MIEVNIDNPYVVVIEQDAFVNNVVVSFDVFSIPCLEVVMDNFNVVEVANFYIDKGTIDEIDGGEF